MAGDRRKPLYIGAAESSLAQDYNEAAGRKRHIELNSKLGTSWDAVMANLRLLSEAHSRLTGSPRDVSVQYGKGNLALGDILPIFDGMKRLWQEEAEKPLARLDESVAVLHQRDELRKQLEISIQLKNTADLERNQAREERDSYLNERNSMQKERDTLLHEKIRFEKESERLRLERDTLRKEKEQSHKDRLKEKAEEESRFETIRQTTLQDFKKEKVQLSAQLEESRQGRDSAEREARSLRIERDQYQIQVQEVENLRKVAVTKLTSSEINLGNLRSTHVATVTKQGQIRAELTNVVAGHRKELESCLRTQRKTLQGTARTEINGLRTRLTSDHDQAVRTLVRSWEQEKIGIEASAATDRDALNDMRLETRSKETSHSTILKTHQNRLKLLSQATTRKQELIQALVITMAVFASSYSDLQSAFVRRGTIVIDDIDQILKLEEKLTQLQDELKHLRKDLQDKEEKLDELATANEANLLSLREVQRAHKACEYDRRLQLGRINRHTFFEDFSALAKSPSERGRTFKGQENGRDVDVCFCVISEGSEALCVIRRFGDASTVWQSKVDDCSTFSLDWQTWLCLGTDGQGRPIYVCLVNAGEPMSWLRKAISGRPLRSVEVDRIKQMK